jgi:hypothetical protein
MGPTGRLQMALSLSQQARDLAFRAIRKTLPDASEEEVRLRFVELNYGIELATELRRFLAARRGDSST